MNIVYYLGKNFGKVFGFFTFSTIKLNYLTSQGFFIPKPYTAFSQSHFVYQHSDLLNSPLSTYSNNVAKIK